MIGLPAQTQVLICQMGRRFVISQTSAPRYPSPRIHNFIEDIFHASKDNRSMASTVGCKGMFQPTRVGTQCGSPGEMRKHSASRRIKDHLTSGVIVIADGIIHSASGYRAKCANPVLFQGRETSSNRGQIACHAG